MRTRERSGLGALVLGLIIVGVGIYYLLTNTFGYDLPEIDWDLVWPILIIGLGLAIVYRAMSRRTGSGQP